GVLDGRAEDDGPRVGSSLYPVLVGQDGEPFGAPLRAPRVLHDEPVAVVADERETVPPRVLGALGRLDAGDAAALRERPREPAVVHVARAVDGTRLADGCLHVDDRALVDPVVDADRAVRRVGVPAV